MPASRVKDRTLWRIRVELVGNAVVHINQQRWAERFQHEHIVSGTTFAILRSINLRTLPILWQSNAMGSTNFVVNFPNKLVIDVERFAMTFGDVCRGEEINNAVVLEFHVMNDAVCHKSKIANGRQDINI